MTGPDFRRGDRIRRAKAAGVGSDPGDRRVDLLLAMTEDECGGAVVLSWPGYPHPGLSLHCGPSAYIGPRVPFRQYLAGFRPSSCRWVTAG
jgi:hypothetical protein